MLPQKTLNICNTFTEVKRIMGWICIYYTIIFKQQYFSNQLELFLQSKRWLVSPHIFYILNSEY